MPCFDKLYGSYDEKMHEDAINQIKDILGNDLRREKYPGRNSDVMRTYVYYEYIRQVCEAMMADRGAKFAHTVLEDAWLHADP